MSVCMYSIQVDVLCYKQSMPKLQQLQASTASHHLNLTWLVTKAEAEQGKESSLSLMMSLGKADADMLLCFIQQIPNSVPQNAMTHPHLFSIIPSPLHPLITITVRTSNPAR